MAIPIIMPRQGQSVETCILTALLKKPGESVSKGDILFEYETDKASFEEEAPQDGIFLGAFFEEGEEIPVLQTVCVIGNSGEDISEFDPRHASHADIQETPLAEKEPEKTESVSGGGNKKSDASDKRLKISPRARKKAELKNIPIHELSGTGPQGRILDRDVEKWLQQHSEPIKKETTISTPKTVETASPQKSVVSSQTSIEVSSEGEYEIRPLTNIRKIIAKAMHQSLQSSAQLTHHLSADARMLLSCRKKAKASGLDFTLNDFICFAVVKALQIYPQVNAHLADEKLKLFKNVHLGIAVDTERGLMVPVIKNADGYNLKGLSKQMHDLATASRTGSIDPDLISPQAASFTVSNLGNYGVEMFTPVINLPQVAILGVNTIIYRPKPLEDGTLAIVPQIGLSLTYDHRALDGGEATRFVKEIANQIEALDPERIFA